LPIGCNFFRSTYKGPLKTLKKLRPNFSLKASKKAEKGPNFPEFFCKHKKFRKETTLPLIYFVFYHTVLKEVFFTKEDFGGCRFFR
jgi:hypothetical protein